MTIEPRFARSGGGELVQMARMRPGWRKPHAPSDSRSRTSDEQTAQPASWLLPKEAALGQMSCKSMPK
eukprot:365253-Chlamydomonas_euryale.AAC.11